MCLELIEAIPVYVLEKFHDMVEDYRYSSHENASNWQFSGHLLAEML